MAKGNGEAAAQKLVADGFAKRREDDGCAKDFAIAATVVAGRRLFPEEVREGGERIGFHIVTLDGQCDWLARKGLSSPYRVGKYGVDMDAIARTALPRAGESVAGSDTHRRG